MSSFSQKYNVPGPRYTSYPTVPYWEQTPTKDEWVRDITNELLRAERVGTGAALYVHIPFCQALCTYCGCNTRITRNHSVGRPYVESVLKEFDLYLKEAREVGFDRPWPLAEIHFGGGTPTFLEPEELHTLVSGLLSRSRTIEHAEFSFEADPRVTTEKHLKTLRELGFSRMSLGIQDFDPRVQEIVHRVQSEIQVARVVETARTLGFKSINFDLIYGLPLQTLKSVENTIEAVCRLRPDRIAFYGYAHVPWIKPGQRRFTEADLPSGDEKRALYERGRELLEAAGYLEIGMDHFALASDSLSAAQTEKTLHRNFMGYISRSVFPLVGLGVSAIGDAWRSFSQNEKLLEKYQERVERGEIPILRGHVLTEEDLALRRHILNLMTRFETSWSEKELYTEYLREVPERLSELSRDGLVTLTSTSCQVTAAGRAFLRNICMAFDSRLARKAPDTQLFSKTV